MASTNPPTSAPGLFLDWRPPTAIKKHMIPKVVDAASAVDVFRKSDSNNFVAFGRGRCPRYLPNGGGAPNPQGIWTKHCVVCFAGPGLSNSIGPLEFASQTKVGPTNTSGSQTTIFSPWQAFGRLGHWTATAKWHVGVSCCHAYLLIALSLNFGGLRVFDAWILRDKCGEANLLR